VRLEVAENMPTELEQFLLEQFQLTTETYTGSTGRSTWCV